VWTTARSTRVVVRALHAVVALTVFAATGCNRASPMAPATGEVDGRWAGTMRDRWAGTVRVELDANRREQTWHGTFRLDFDDPAFNVTGSFLGDSRHEPVVDMFLLFETAGRDCPEPEVRLYFARMIQAGSRLTGTYEPTVGCPVLDGGSIELTRR
jgi:hypothetical protein